MQKRALAAVLAVLAIGLGIWGYMELTGRDESPDMDPAKLVPEEITPEAPKAEAETTEVDYGPESQMRLLTYTDYTRLYPNIVLRSGDPNSRYVALTFDDGPDQKYTPQILDILKNNGVKATFFFLGANAEKYPDVVRRAANEGHLIASHGYVHANFANLTPDQIRDNLRRSQQILQSLTGKRTTLFRPPYAAINSRAVETIAAEGYKIVLWNVDSLDWKSIPKATVLANVLPATTSGAIILQHSAGGPDEDLSGTVQALPSIITTLRNRGYQLVTVDRLLELRSNSVTNWYTVRPGDTFYTIAQSHGMTVRNLMELNPNVDPNYLYVGQRLVVSGSQHNAQQPAQAGGVYTVQPGDTLWKISQKLGISVSTLQQLNPGLNPSQLRVGQKLKTSGAAR